MTRRQEDHPYPYDYLVVGCGLYGATMARILTDAGFRCLIIDKRHHIAGNCYTSAMEGIHVHAYGAHIFHTSNQTVWKFVHRFADFNHYVNSPKAISEGKLYSLPFNMNTFYELWEARDPATARTIIESQRFKGNPENLEQQALSLVGRDIYEKLIKGYTQKQWGKHPRDLPAFIIKRLPLRFTYNNNYFNDRYQGIPIGGYTSLFENMLKGIEVRLSTDFFADRAYFASLAGKLIYTGCIDEFFGHRHGRLEYRSLEFRHEVKDTDNFQGNAVINYCDVTSEHTRIIEHKHFEFLQDGPTVITREYPKTCGRSDIPYYPVNDSTNQAIHRRYREEAAALPDMIFGGRLSEYKYMDMHVVIESAMNRARTELRSRSREPLIGSQSLS